MTWSTAIIAALLSLPTPAESELTSARAARVEMIGRVAIEVTAPAWSGWSHRQRAALLLAKISAESGNLSLAVHDGTKRSDGGQSICLGQIHWGRWLRMTRAQWLALGGADETATRRCLSETWRQLGLHRNLCAPGSPSLAGVAKLFSSYGTGKGCGLRSWALPRARHWERLARR